MADNAALQEFELIDELGCQPDVEYKTKLAKFQRVSSISCVRKGCSVYA